MDTNRKIDIMGIVNLTDDSYFAGSRCLEGNDVEKAADNAVGKASRMIENGATIIDIGACSTRQGSEPVGAKEEWRRLEPALKKLVRALPGTPVSIDTWWADVIRLAYETVASEYDEDTAKSTLIINDISAGEDDPQMLPLAGTLSLKYIAMHKRGNSKTMQSLCNYENVTEEIERYFEIFSEKAEKYNIREWVLDPGFGFAKTIDQNYQLLKEMDRLTAKFSKKGIRTLVGVSRKSMIYRLFGITPQESLCQTQVLHLKALQNGADILRVHDVEEAARTVELYRRLG